MNVSTRAAAIAAGSLIGAALLLSGAIVANSATDSSVTASLNVLRDVQRPADKLPAYVPLALHGDTGLIAGSSRYLGAEPSVRYWTALDRSGSVCLVTVFPRTEYAASTCQQPDDFLDGGVVLLVDDAAQNLHRQAFLVPDGALRSALPGGWTVVAPNLVTVAPDRVAGSIEVTLPGGTPLTLTTIPPAS